MSSGSAPKRSYDPTSLMLEIQRLKIVIGDARTELERIEPLARLEDACIAYGRAPRGSLVGAGDRKQKLERDLAELEHQLQQAQTMNGLVQAEMIKANADAHASRMNDILARLNEDAECGEWIRYQRGERPVFGAPAWGMPDIAGPKLPEKAPSRERIAKYRALEAERMQIISEGGNVGVVLQTALTAHPEYLEIIAAEKETEAA